MAKPLQMVIPQRIVYPMDFMAGDDWSEPLFLSEVLEFLFCDRLTPFARKAHERGKAVETSVTPGWVHLGSDKHDLINQESTVFVRTFNRLLQFAACGYDYMTFATFRVKQRKSWERRRANISSVRAFVVDIDSKQWPAAEIQAYAASHGLEPSIINETPRGYHLWYVLNQEFIGPHERDSELTKVGKFYNDLNDFLYQFFDKAFPSAESGTDRLIGGERYIRIPKKVLSFTRKVYSITDLIQKKNELCTSSKPKTSKSMPAMTIPRHALLEDPAWSALQEQEPKPSMRRRTAFTIALLYRSLGYDELKTHDILKGWYGHLQDKRDFAWPEVERTIKRAFCGKYKGPSREWVEKLTGISPKIFYSKNKSNERENKSIEFWKNAFLTMLKAKGGSWCVSNRELCSVMQLSSRAMLDKMIDHLLEIGCIYKTVSGKGRSAETTYQLVLDGADPDSNSNGSKVISIEKYRRERSILGCLNDPFPPMPLNKSIRDGGRDPSVFCSPDSS